MVDRPPYLLVADDDLDMRKLLLAAASEAAPGLEIHSAVDGGVALELVREHAPVALLLDQDMPVLDGLGVLEALRKDEATRTLPVLMISAQAGSEHRSRAASLGHVRFLSKPVQPSVVARVVREVLAEQGRPSLVPTAPPITRPPVPRSETDGGIEAAAPVVTFQDLPPGFRVGEYEVKEVLAFGGMATVYRGEHPRIGKRVAIKVVHARLASEPEITRRFLVEARAANLIAHPNLVDVFAYGELPDGRPYLVMELVEGHDLRHLLLDQGPLSEAGAIPIFCQLCDALGAMHDGGLLHRDVKPENILCAPGADGTPRVRLLDLGVVKPYGLREGAGHDTRAGVAIGTPRYMAPEQLQERALGPATDLYALGLVLYEMMTGKLPWQAQTEIEHMIAHTQKVPELDAEFEARSPGLARLVRELLEKDPDLRPSSAALVRWRLEEIARVADTVTSVWARTGQAEPRGVAAQGAPELSLPPTARSGRLVAVFALVLALGAAVLALALR